MVAFAHDPDGRYLEDFAPMGDGKIFKYKYNQILFLFFKH